MHPLDKGHSPFRNTSMPWHPYSSQSFAMPRTQVDEPARDVRQGSDGHGRNLAVEDEEDESLGGEIISPRNADRRRQALVDKISPLDIA